MKENGASNHRTMTLLFIGGAVLGAVAGILLAPKSGGEIRREIKDYASKVRGEVVDAAQRAKAGVEAAMEKGRMLLSESKVA
jgi:gas vesicle protein